MTPDAGATLLAIARAEIVRSLGRSVAAPEEALWLGERGATFVTLRKNGELRGCVGSIDPQRSLLEDVKANAVGAAFRDRRFAPVTPAELGSVRIEVSLLSPLNPIVFGSEEEAIAQLRPFEDGIVLEHASARGTFLPQVWGMLPHAADFLCELKRKAGLPASFWSGDVRLFRYSVSKWSETTPSTVQSS